MSDMFWVFGYGSLIWKPPPHVQERVPGYIRGYVRRFWQSSNDHRGTPEAPGRVVTLVDAELAFRQEIEVFGKSNINVPKAITWGVAYGFNPKDVPKLYEYLDLREINGYSRHFLQVYDHLTSCKPKIERALVYIGTPDNEAYVGPSPARDLALHIMNSRGPSGENLEYLEMMYQSVRQLSQGESGDDHVGEIVACVEDIQSLN